MDNDILVLRRYQFVMVILCSAGACPTHDLAHYHHRDVWCCRKLASTMAARDCPPLVDARVGWLVDLLAVERIVLKSADEIFESKQSFPGTQHAGLPKGLNGSASHLGGRHAAGVGRRRIGCFRAGVNQLDGHPRTAARNRRCGPYTAAFGPGAGRGGLHAGRSYQDADCWKLPV